MKKPKLEIGDYLQGFELGKPIGVMHEITETTKKLAKSKEGNVFFIDLYYNTILPKENCIAEVRNKEKSRRNYYLIK